ncbi:MAG: hypothetical protein CBE47_03640 [Pelagibacteraceae bacterium TMED287]|nr:MAG: hypothetical protein CBE47_03640 [Pelagibacteraceae bacterium TMED287]|tara:strand:+ start:462 stop:1244 length:783 start_codon:yes stop_codon:yes gene_type:complete
MKLSIIIPVYNSSATLEELCERIFNSVKKLGLINDFEIIMINDCSKDDSWLIIKKLSSKLSYLKGINLRKNFGQHNAIMAGLNNCEGEYVITMDDDLQHPPEFFFNILEKLKEFDVCYTYYKNRKHVKWKKIVSKINNIVSSFLLNKQLNIYMSSYRGIKRDVVKKIIINEDANVYLDSFIIKTTKNIGMITVDHFARKKGESNYTLNKLLILWSNMVLNFSFYPLRIASLLGSVLKIIVKILRIGNSNKVQFEIIEKTF